MPLQVGDLGGLLLSDGLLILGRLAAGARLGRLALPLQQEQQRVRVPVKHAREPGRALLGGRAVLLREKGAPAFGVVRGGPVRRLQLGGRLPVCAALGLEPLLALRPRPPLLDEQQLLGVALPLQPQRQPSLVRTRRGHFTRTSLQ